MIHTSWLLLSQIKRMKPYAIIGYRVDSVQLDKIYIASAGDKLILLVAM
jgi:hypothetical protein